MRAGLLYSTQRLLLLLAALGVFYLAGLRGIVLWMVALVASGVASYFLLSKQRDAMSVGVERALSRVNDRIDAATRKEDID